jgi:hypothetical protein
METTKKNKRTRTPQSHLEDSDLWRSVENSFQNFEMTLDQAWANKKWLDGWMDG